MEATKRKQLERLALSKLEATAHDDEQGLAFRSASRQALELQAPKRADRISGSSTTQGRAMAAIRSVCVQLSIAEKTYATVMRSVWQRAAALRVRCGWWQSCLCLLWCAANSAYATERDCALEPRLRSVEWSTPTTITFANNSSGTIRTYWLDYQGGRKFYAELPAGQSYVQQTYVTHPWVVTTTEGNCLGIYMPENVPSRVALGAGPGAHTPRQCPAEVGLRSMEGSTATWITFTNNTSGAIRTYWLDYQGARKFYAEVPSGQSYDQQTYVTHPWVVTDRANDCLGVYMPDSIATRVAVEAFPRLEVIENDARLGQICNGPLGPGPCAAIQKYFLQLSGQIALAPVDAQQLRVINNVPGVGPVCDGPLGPGPCGLVQQYLLEHSASALASALPGLQDMDSQQVAIECAKRTKLDVTAFASCTGQRLILSQNQQAVLDCAMSSSTTIAFAECAAPQMGLRLSNDQRILAGCAMKSKGDTSQFFACAGSAFIGRNLTPDERAVLDCARNSNDASGFAACSASHILGPRLSKEQQIAIRCAAQSQGDYTGMATCTGANLFNLNLNPEQQIAVQCVVSTGGQPYAAAGCIATRLTARELTKCFTDGFGGERGCFGDNNDLFGKNGWTARTLGQLAGGPNSVVRNPSQIWGGDNSFVRNPGQIWGGDNSFVRNPSQFWGGNNSVFNNPNQLAPKPVTVGTVGGKRICIPWC